MGAPLRHQILRARSAAIIIPVGASVHSLSYAGAGLASSACSRLKPWSEPTRIGPSCMWHRGKISIPRSTDQTWRHRQQLESSEQQVWWIAAAIMAIFGGVWGFIPLYKIYCQAIGQGQATQTGHKEYSAPPHPNSA